MQNEIYLDIYINFWKEFPALIKNDFKYRHLPVQMDNGLI